MLPDSPSGTEVLSLAEFSFDWGTVNPGPTVGVFSYVPPPEHSPVVIPQGPFPAGTLGVSLWAGSNQIFMQCINNNLVPTLVGVVKYKVLLFNDLVLR